MLDGEIVEELRRCSVCETRRPAWAFTSKVQTERNGAVGRYSHNACRACSSGSSPPQKLKRAGAPIAEVQAAANTAIDRIRAKDGHGAWDPKAHRPEKADNAEEVFDWRAHPIIKMCKCCQEIMPHDRRGSAMNRVEFIESRTTCRGCFGAQMRTYEGSGGAYGHLGIDERRKKRDASISATDLRSDRAARGVSWCSSGKHEASVSHFGLQVGKGKSGRLNRQGSCYSCSNHRHLKNFLTGEALFADNETRRLRAEAKAAGKTHEPLIAPLELVGGRAIVPDRPVAPAPSLDEYVAARQERFERAEEAPKPSRQVRRAAERRIVKDAVSASKRVMTDVEVVKTAIGRAMAAKSRSAGGTKNVRRTVSKKAWALDPAAVGAMLKAQKYRCALTGERFQESTGYGSMQPFAPSPNRINPGGDYVIENCEFVTWWCNRLVGDMPRDLAIEFLRERKLLRKDFGQLSML